MTPSAMSEPMFQRLALEKTCAYCGARFALQLARMAEDNELFDIHCPECEKTYHVEAALEPEMRLVVPRSDGRRDRYEETMF